MGAFWQTINYKMLQGSKLYLLIGINVAVFLTISIFSVIEFLFFRTDLVNSFKTEYLALPSYLPKLAVRFWTPITYMFMHAGFFHILFNMLWLYWMGEIFEEYLGNKRTLGLYLMGGLAGAFFYVLSFNVLPAFTQTHAFVFSTAVGASASVMAIIVATATLLPDYAIPLILIGPVKLKWLVLFYIVIDFLGIKGANAGGEIAHLGGALIGFIYMKQLQKGHDWIAGISNLFRSRSKLKVASKNTSYHTSSKPRQDEVDRILDKISRSGYDSLNKQEKEVLFKASKDD